MTTSKVFAQKVSFGPSVGLLFDNPTGSVLLDSIQVTLRGDNDRQPYLGGYLSYELSPSFTVSSGINYYNSYKGARVYNTSKDGFERLIHTTSGGNRSLELPVLVEYQLPVRRRSLFVMAGVSPNIRLTRDGQDYFSNKFISPAMAEVLYNFKAVSKPVVWKYSLGIGANVWRLRVEARWQYDFSSTTNSYKVWGKQFDFQSRNNTIRFGLGYNLNWNKNLR
ncbi:hypothetical protein PKOR_15965 [Pontibacter korlensis]|uniref:Outer membrane protein beta-barrel domain-containing protein n=1 Tax=Pontibacter korlensis TaxID=400092 RepID=A0A0E3UXJ2_9BACT|nr:hypothetical protein PKOR_15965 [Pontibacter korlensis]